MGRRGVTRAMVALERQPGEKGQPVNQRHDTTRKIRVGRRIGAAAVFYCIGPIPDAGAAASQTVSARDDVGAPASVSFDSIQQALADNVPLLYNQMCIQQTPLPAP
jgi:hypothetical protein